MAARASAEFDAGVEHFAAAQYEAATRAFLRADVLAASSDALSNALVAARRTGNHLLVIEVAERALGRDAIDPGLVSEARRVLSDMARHVAHVRLACRPAPCDVFVDDAPAKEGSLYQNPGTHRISASFSDDRTVSRSVSLDADTEYEFVLEPSAPPAKAAAAPHPSPRETASSDEGGGISNHDIILYSGIAATATLLGFTIGSGIDAWSFNDSLADPSPEALVLDARSRMTRTDMLLTATVGTALLTTAWWIFGPDDSKPSDVPRASVNVSSTGAFFLAEGRWP